MHRMENLGNDRIGKGIDENRHGRIDSDPAIDPVMQTGQWVFHWPTVCIAVLTDYFVDRNVEPGQRWT
jgi:hypothetical protein